MKRFLSNITNPNILEHLKRYLEKEREREEKEFRRWKKTHFYEDEEEEEDSEGDEEDGEENDGEDRDENKCVKKEVVNEEKEKSNEVEKSRKNLEDVEGEEEKMDESEESLQCSESEEEVEDSDSNENVPEIEKLQPETSTRIFQSFQKSKNRKSVKNDIKIETFAQTNQNEIKGKKCANKKSKKLEKSPKINQKSKRNSKKKNSPKVRKINKSACQKPTKLKKEKIPKQKVERPKKLTTKRLSKSNPELETCGVSEEFLKFKFQSSKKFSFENISKGCNSPNQKSSQEEEETINILPSHDSEPENKPENEPSDSSDEDVICSQYFSSQPESLNVDQNHSFDEFQDLNKPKKNPNPKLKLKNLQKTKKSDKTIENLQQIEDEHLSQDNGAIREVDLKEFSEDVDDFTSKIGKSDWFILSDDSFDEISKEKEDSRHDISSQYFSKNENNPEEEITDEDQQVENLTKKSVNKENISDGERDIDSPDVVISSQYFSENRNFDTTLEIVQPVRTKINLKKLILESEPEKKICEESSSDDEILSQYFQGKDHNFYREDNVADVERVDNDTICVNDEDLSETTVDTVSFCEVSRIGNLLGDLSGADLMEKLRGSELIWEVKPVDNSPQLNLAGEFLGSKKEENISETKSNENLPEMGENKSESLESSKDQIKTKRKSSTYKNPKKLKKPQDGSKPINKKSKSSSKNPPAGTSEEPEFTPDELHKYLDYPTFKKRPKKRLPKNDSSPKLPPGAATPLWSPPRSPHNLIEEEYVKNPWGLLVATIFLNKTSGKQAKPVIDSFLKQFPDPYSVIEKDPKDLERFFDDIGLRKRAEQIWKMSKEFVGKNWRHAKELHGIGKYGDDAFKIFCLGDLSCEPEDRYLKIYHSWVTKKRNWEEENQKDIDDPD